MKNYRITRNTEYKTGSEQPFGKDTMRFATDRAMYGLKDNDYSIGIESGIFYNPINDMYYDLHYCAVIDRYSTITTGFGSGFQMPDEVIDAIKTGTSTNEFVEITDGNRVYIKMTMTAPTCPVRGTVNRNNGSSIAQ